MRKRWHGCISTFSAITENVARRVRRKAGITSSAAASTATAASLHGGCAENPVGKYYQLSYAQKQKDKNLHAYYDQHRAVRQNISLLYQELKKRCCCRRTSRLQMQTTEFYSPRGCGRNRHEDFYPSASARRRADNTFRPDFSAHPPCNRGRSRCGCRVAELVIPAFLLTLREPRFPVIALNVLIHPCQRFLINDNDLLVSLPAVFSFFSSASFDEICHIKRNSLQICLGARPPYSSSEMKSFQEYSVSSSIVTARTEARSPCFFTNAGSTTFIVQLVRHPDQFHCIRASDAFQQPIHSRVFPV